jgi:hypothetical protein
MPLDLSTAAVAPPRSNRSQTRATATAQKAATGKAKEREEALHGVIQLAGMGLIIAGQHADAGAVNMHGPGIAHEFAQLADKNEKVGRGIDYITEAGPYAGVIMAVMPLALQVLTNHGILKAEALAGAGIMHPDAIAAQVKADLARQAQEAIKAQRMAERELHEMAKERAAAQNSDGAG